MPLWTILTKVTGAARSTMQVTEFGGTCWWTFSRPGRTRDVADARSKSLKDRIQALHRLVRSSDHHAVAALKTPDATAGTNVNIVNSIRGDFLGTPYVVDIVGVTAIDQNVAGIEQRQADRGSSCPRLRPAPSTKSPGAFRAFSRNLPERRAACRLVLYKVRDRDWATCRTPRIGDRAATKPSYHVGAHSAEADHSELHCHSP